MNYYEEDDSEVTPKDLISTSSAAWEIDSSILKGISATDDNGYGRNAFLRYYTSAITRELEAGVPYLIITCQYDPSSTFENLDEGDDLILRISKN